jgi:hypothetical protein
MENLRHAFVRVLRLMYLWRPSRSGYERQIFKRRKRIPTEFVSQFNKNSRL